ncbi:MAG: hypothetical protein ACI4MS_07775 [Candidatus Coproplasma sp.]
MKKYKVQPLDLMQYINTKYHEPFIHFLIEFESLPDRDRLSDALEKLTTVFPLLKCRYNDKDNVFEEVDNFAVNNILSTDENHDKNALLTQSLYYNEKLVQFTFSDNTLIITISHLLCDGSGFKNLIYLLCDFYNGKCDDDYCYLMDRDFSVVSKNIKSTTSMTMKMLFSMLGNYKNEKVYEKSQDQSVFLTQRTIAAETMSIVHDYAKKLGSTLNDVFLTAYARALCKTSNRKKINIPCTVDLRKYSGCKSGIANLTGTYNLNTKIAVQENFMESLRNVTEKMTRQKATKNDVAGPYLLVSKYEKSSLDDFMKLYGGMDTSAYTDYTNLGKTDHNRLTFGDAVVKDAVGYGGLNKAPYFQIAVSTFKETTTVSSIFRCSEKEKTKADILLDNVIDEINSFYSCISSDL